MIFFSIIYDTDIARWARVVEVRNATCKAFSGVQEQNSYSARRRGIQWLAEICWSALAAAACSFTGALARRVELILLAGRWTERHGQLQPQQCTAPVQLVRWRQGRKSRCVEIELANYSVPACFAAFAPCTQ